jgi:trehalose 6-phosphate synthase/phosphatase
VTKEGSRRRRAPRARGAEGSLVVVSNRLPFTTVQSKGRVRFKRSPGGLVAALDPALARRGGVWVGWPGVETEDAASAAEMMPPSPRSSKVRYRPVPLSRREVNLYYGGFANRTLWPLFHYFQARTEINSATWTVYDRVNERFAQAAAEEGDDEALVWVHDYQLIRVPRYLRRLATGRRIAFFLHIPFPAYDVFRILPWARSLMRGMLSCDLVGFQSAEHAEHFVTCAERLLGCAVDRAAGTVQFEGRPVAVQAHPIGIDVGHFERLAQKVGPAGQNDGQPIEILGLDRLDYTKGIPERLRAVEVFFERNPAYRGHTTFLQLAVPSRTGVEEYQALKREVDEMVGRINGRFSEHGWTPIHYLVRSVNQDDLVRMYRHARVALLTPLRDGMNLVAKEFVASQIDDDGVLILSELAGAAEELKEAILVNPYDIDEVADAIHRAVLMPADERRARMLALRHRVRAGDVEGWVNRFVSAAEAACRRAEQMQERSAPTDAVRRRLQRWLGERPAVALFFDYDGTLTPIVDRPEDAVLSPAARRALRQATRTPNLDVAIVSGRSLADIKKMVGLPGLTYVGNHGFEIEGPGVKYRHEGLARYERAVEASARELGELAIDGAWLERKGATLSFHYRKVPAKRQREAEDRATAILKRNKLRVTHGKCVVEGRPPIDWNKGYAVLHVLARRHGADWSARVRALYFGDDVTDEDAFRSLSGIGRSIRVGPATQSAADLSLPDPEAVIDLLRWLASGAFKSEERCRG